MTEENLKIYSNRSIFTRDDGEQEIFLEGSLSPEAKARLNAIKSAFEDGFLQKEIDACKETEFSLDDIDNYIDDLQGLVDSITSEVGRAVVGLIVLQLSIKCVCFEQSIRLHKTSWREGVAMRSLDASYNTPLLRRNGLLSVNKFGVFMTRSLAENYPYTKFYKASIKGAKDSWINIVEGVERGDLNPRSSLRFILSALLRETESFQRLSEETLSVCDNYIESAGVGDKKSYLSIFISTSSYSARLLEIAMHSLMQVLEDDFALPGAIKPLSQMRSANKKHGNIADIEVMDGFSNLQIVEAYDAKYGKSYLRDEIEELADKLENHPEVRIAGFVTDCTPDLRPDIVNRVSELEEIYDIDIRIQSFSEWINDQLSRANSSEEAILDQWIRAFTETLCQKRRHRAPIDEPVSSWVLELREFFERHR